MVVEYKRYKRDMPEGWSDAWMNDVIQAMVFKARDFDMVRRGVAGMKATCESRGYVQEARNLAWALELLECADPTHLPGMHARLHQPDCSSDTDGDDHPCGACRRQSGLHVVPVARRTVRVCMNWARISMSRVLCLGD